MKALRQFVLTPLLITLVSLPVLAQQTPTNKDYVYLGIGDVGFSPSWAESNTVYKNPSFTIGGGKYYNDNLIFDGFLRYSENQNKAKTIKMDVIQLGVSAILISDKLGDSPIKLYVKTSAISAYQDARSLPNGDYSTSEAGGVFDIGAGFEWDIGSDFWVRGEYLYGYATSGLMVDADYDGFLLTIGKGL